MQRETLGERGARSWEIGAFYFRISTFHFGQLASCQQDEGVQAGRAFSLRNLFDPRPRIGRALVDPFRAARERELEQRGLQLFLLGRLRLVKNFS